MEEKHIMKIRKKKKKHIIKIKKTANNVTLTKETEAAQKIRIYSTKKFYEQYLKENETPSDFITNVKFIVSQIEHLFRYNPDNIPGKQLSKILTKNVDVNIMLGLIIETSPQKLKMLNIHDSALIILEKLYYIITRLQKEYGIVVTDKYTADDIRFKLQLMKFKYQPLQKLERMFVIKDNSIVETGENIECSKALNGTSIMVEYMTNRFTNIPYKFYNRITNIKEATICIKIAQDSDIEYDYENHIMLTEEDDVCLVLEEQFNSKDIKKHISNVFRYIDLCDTMDSMGINTGVTYINFNEYVLVTEKDTDVVKKYSIEEYIGKYFDYL